jgi:hypothetical protein
VRGVYQPVITYSPRILKDPEDVIATFAHELSHYIMHQYPTAPPGGEYAEEPATDVCSVYLGFGVMMANSAFKFRQTQGAGMVGWEAQRKGYLSQSELAFALAMFAHLAEFSPDQVVPHLSANPRAQFQQHYAALSGEYGEMLDYLRDVRPRPPV